MPVASWENLDVFLDPVNGFAVVARIFPARRDAFDASVILDETGITATLGAQYSREETAIRIGGKESDLKGLNRGDMVKIGPRTFDVMSPPYPDGTGWASLRIAAQQGSSGR